MSTSYYYIQEPITSLRLEEGPGHDRLTVWQSGANAGTLVLTKGSARTIISLFAEHAEDDRCPMRTHFGGVEVGCVVTENVRGLDPSLILISEYGELFTVAQIRAFAGEGRKP